MNIADFRATRGKRIPDEVNALGHRLVRSGKSNAEIKAQLGVSNNTMARWRAEVTKKPTKTVANRVVSKPRKKIRKKTPLDFVADRLAEIGQMLRAGMPDITKFNLTVTPDGKANIEYAIRQTTEVAGAVKL